jgi:hypothetical protein
MIASLTYAHGNFRYTTNNINPVNSGVSKRTRHCFIPVLTGGFAVEDEETVSRPLQIEEATTDHQRIAATTGRLESVL